VAEHTDAYTANRAFAVGVEHHLHRTDFTDTIYQKSFIFFGGGQIYCGMQLLQPTQIWERWHPTVGACMTPLLPVPPLLRDACI